MTFAHENDTARCVHGTPRTAPACPECQRELELLPDPDRRGREWLVGDIGRLAVLAEKEKRGSPFLADRRGSGVVVERIRGERRKWRSGKGRVSRKIMLVPIRNSAMRDLWTDLACELSASGARARPVCSPAAWLFNLERARRLIGSFVEPVDALGAMASRCSRRACAYCHTPVLVGFRLDGRLITSRSLYCGPACRMRLRRRRPALARRGTR